jgi:hypothetical protein
LVRQNEVILVASEEAKQQIRIKDSNLIDYQKLHAEKERLEVQVKEFLVLEYVFKRLRNKLNALEVEKKDLEAVLEMKNQQMKLKDDILIDFSNLKAEKEAFAMQVQKVNEDFNQVNNENKKLKSNVNNQQYQKLLIEQYYRIKSSLESD